MSGHEAPLPRVSFIVPVFNDAERLARCLRSIRASRYPSDRIEIVVADNGSQDGSPEIARSAGAILVAAPHVSVAALRNRAAHASRGSILAYVDADNEVVPGWVESAVETLRLPAVGAVGALYHPPPNGTWVQHGYDGLRGRPAGRQDVEWIGSGNLAIWRSAFEAVDGFDTSLETCEDVDLCHRLRAAGLRVISDERMKNIHHGDPATLWELFKGELWRGRDNLRVSFRRPLRWRTVTTAIIPLVDIGLIGLAVGGLFVGGAVGRAVSLAALLVILAPSVLKAARSLARRSPPHVAYAVQVFAVACVYDLGRAFALIARARHRNTRPAVIR
jgi:GT2 family glycosyltransferase